MPLPRFTHLLAQPLLLSQVREEKPTRNLIPLIENELVLQPHDLDLLQNLKGFFRGPCYILPLSLMKLNMIHMVHLHHS